MNTKPAALFAAFCLLLCFAMPTQAARLTGPQVVAKCKAVYSGLSSYDGTVQSASGSRSSTYATKNTARITFRRPDLLDVEGTVQFPGGHAVKYALLSDGKTNLVNVGGHWNKPPSPETAIAALSGISGGAASTIPSMVLHTAWGTPLLFQAAVPAAAPVETLNGRPAYRISVVQGPTTETYWIDSKTFLFMKVATVLAGSSSTRVFSTPVLNGPTALSLAALRKKMPHIDFRE